MRRFCKYLSIFLTLALVQLFVAPRSAPAAADAFIDNLVINNADDSMLLYFNVANAFRPDMEEAVQNGIPATFTFYVSLSRVKKGWPDTEEFYMSFDHTLGFDNLKEEYVIRYSEPGKSTDNVKSVADAKKLMSEVNGLRVLDESSLVSGGHYTLKVKARLERKTLPLNFHYIIPFWELGDFETDWRVLDFTYRQKAVDTK